MIRCIIPCAMCVALLAAATRAEAQDASLFRQGGGDVGDGASTGPLTLKNGSFIFREVPQEQKVRELQKRDIITVLVDYRTQMSSEGDAETRKTTNLVAKLANWIKFDGKSIKPAPQRDGDPTISGSLNDQYRAQAEVELRDSMTFRIAAMIVDIQPNGNLVIEANWNVENNEERWRISLTGIVRRESIQPNRTVTSDAIHDLKIVKREMGQVRDGYARGWFREAYDRYKPF